VRVTGFQGDDVELSAQAVVRTPVALQDLPADVLQVGGGKILSTPSGALAGRPCADSFCAYRTLERRRECVIAAPGCDHRSSPCGCYDLFGHPDHLRH